MSEADPKPPQPAPAFWTKRPLFAPNQLLSAQQLNKLVEDQRAHSQALMRALHGSGVIFGFAVSPDDKRDQPKPSNGDEAACGSNGVEISCGMALDCHGRLLRWRGGSLRFVDLVGPDRCPGTYTLTAHYAEKRMAKDGCGPCAGHADWVEEGVVFTLQDGCKTEECCPQHARYDGWDDYLCAQTGSTPSSTKEWDTVCKDGGTLCPIECGDRFYDPGAGVAIACVEIGNIAAEGCDAVIGFCDISDACCLRPYVHRTPLLYDLIRGGQNDLARVESLSWQDWCVGVGTTGFDHIVAWKDFARKFKTKEELVITFTRPIRVETAHRGSIFFTSVRRDKEADYVITRRIPANIEPIDGDGILATRFRIVVNPAWVRNEITTASYLRGGGRIELTIRGQMLRDECGRMLDAVPIGYDRYTPAPICAGGDLLAMFRFDKAPAPERKQDQSED